MQLLIKYYRFNPTQVTLTHYTKQHDSLFLVTDGTRRDSKLVGAGYLQREIILAWFQNNPTYGLSFQINSYRTEIYSIIKNIVLSHLLVKLFDIYP